MPSFQCTLLIKALYTNLCKWLFQLDLHTVYPSHDITLRMCFCIPATNCSWKRSFSWLWRIQNYLRRIWGSHGGEYENGCLLKLPSFYNDRGQNDRSHCAEQWIETLLSLNHDVTDTSARKVARRKCFRQALVICCLLPFCVIWNMIVKGEVLFNYIYIYSDCNFFDIALNAVLLDTVGLHPQDVSSQGSAKT
jgi:hypothetical protein